MKTENNIIQNAARTAIVVLCSCSSLVAQLNPMGAMYFQNQYLANPAISGIDDGVKINLGYRQQPSGAQGAPSIQYFTGEYRFNERAGTSLYIYNDEAGLLSSTKLMASYSYHLPLSSEKRTLHFGLTAGFLKESLDLDKLNGDINDPGVARFNDRGMQFDGDFGMAYSHDKLLIQATFPNMRASFNKDESNAIDRPTFFAAVSYSLTLSETSNISLQPKLCVRGIKGHDHIIDAGANATFLENKLNFFALYHTSRNISAGVGMKLKDRFTLTAIYTSQPAEAQNYANGNIEFGLKATLWEK